MIEFNTIIENLPYGICVIDNDLVIQRYNSKFLERFKILFGCNVAEGTTICSDAPDKFKSNIIAYCVKAINGDESKYTQTVNRNGKESIIQITFQPIRTSDNKISGGLLISNNVTKNIEILNELKEREEKFRRLFEQSNDAIILRTLDGNIIDVNMSSCKMLGYSKEELLKMSTLDFQPKSKQYRETKGMELVKTNGEGIIETYFEKSDGEVISVEVSSRIIDEKTGIVQSIARDISKQKNTELKLHGMNSELTVQKEELQSNLENIKEMQSQLVQAEKMAALGQLIAGIAHEINTPLGAINASVNNISDSLKQVLLTLPELLKKLETDELELFFKILQKADNKMLPLSSKESRKMKKGLTSYFETNGINEAEVVAEAFLYLKIYNYTQEFLPLLKNKDTIFILKAAKNFASLIKNRNNITIAVEKAANIVFALKKFAHKDHIGDKVSTDVTDSLETVLTLYHNQLKQGIEVKRIYNHIPRILCYADEINQIWTNLIHNSIQAMTNSGTLTIETYGDNANVYVNISETGHGIPDDIKEKIFEPFFTTKIQGEGSGLGLDIISQIIEKHKGKISFTSKVGVGTTFNITLPINYSLKQ